MIDGLFLRYSLCNNYLNEVECKFGKCSNIFDMLLWRRCYSLEMQNNWRHIDRYLACNTGLACYNSDFQQNIYIAAKYD